MPNKKRAIRVFKLVMPLVGLACLAIFPPWNGIWAWIEPLPDTVREEVEGAIDHGLDGIVVYIDQSGRQPSFYTAGWKNSLEQVPADPDALFKIASISKLYIAVAAAKLASDQIFSLDDILADHLPELVDRIEFADQITIRMLLKHRSGIPNFMDQNDYPWEDPPKDNSSTLKLVLDKPADFKPDENYSYSNTNYLLIGDIMDRSLGYSHHQYIKEEILNPLQLNRTYSLLSEVDIEDLTSGYFVGYDKDIKYNDFVNPGGSMIATAEDVGVFLRALIDGSLLSEDEQAIYSSIYEYEHTGLLPGYYSIARYHKDIDSVVIQFVNTSGGNSTMTSLVVYNRIVKILMKQLGEDATTIE